MPNLPDNLNSFLFKPANPNLLAADVGLLLARFYAGFTIMNAGLDKLPMPDWMVEQVIEVGFPFPTFFAWIACFTEFAFGFFLVLGLMTRLSSCMLAFTMGVAAFGFQNVLPLVDMHIAQHFFWMFIIFGTAGAGRFSLDYLIRKPTSSTNSPWVYAAIPALLFVVTLAGVREWTADRTPEDASEETISSINIPGSFNAWNPEANEMTEETKGTYVFTRSFEQPGVIAFKFTANRSWEYNLGVAEAVPAQFPVFGQTVQDEGNTTQNINAYIPNSGVYRFEFNMPEMTFSLDSLAGDWK